MTATDILIDPQIRNWVLFPIFIITLLVGLARHYVQQLIKSTQQSKVKKIKPHVPEKINKNNKRAKV